MSKVLVVVQARVGSTRLPGKVFEVIGDAPMVHQVAKRASAVGPVFVAWGEVFPYYSVLDRYATVATMFPNVTTFIRVTGDCPLWTASVGRVVCATWDPKKWDIVGTSPELDGLDTEVFSREALLRTCMQATSTYDREHVTPWMRRNLRFKEMTLPDGPYRWSVDDKEGLAFVRAVYAECALCAKHVEHHTNASNSIGGSDRHPIWDLHAVPVADGVILEECTAYDILKTRRGGPVYVSS